MAAAASFARPVLSRAAHACRARPRARSSRAVPRAAAAAAAAAAAPPDAVVVLAGGLTENGAVPPWVEPRLAAAAELAAAHPSATVLLTGASTPHRPAVLAPTGQVLTEAAAMAERLAELGVERSRIVREAASSDTVGNVFFSLVAHAAPRGWRRLVIVTSDWHAGRSRAIFDWVAPLVAEALLGGRELAVEWRETAGGLEPEARAAREEREAASTAQVRENASRVTDLAAFHTWLHTTHKCYAVSRQRELLEPSFAGAGAPEGAALSSY